MSDLHPLSAVGLRSADELQSILTGSVIAFGMLATLEFPTAFASERRFLVDGGHL